MLSRLAAPSVPPVVGLGQLMSARTRIHHRHQDERGREPQGHVGARDGHRAVLQWLAQQFDDFARNSGSSSRNCSPSCSKFPSPGDVIPAPCSQSRNGWPGGRHRQERGPRMPDWFSPCQPRRHGFAHRSAGRSPVLVLARAVIARCGNVQTEERPALESSRRKRLAPDRSQYLGMVALRQPRDLPRRSRFERDGPRTFLACRILVNVGIDT